MDLSETTKTVMTRFFTFLPDMDFMINRFFSKFGVFSLACPCLLFAEKCNLHLFFYKYIDTVS